MELTDSQIKILSEIYRDIGQVSFASMVVSPFLVGIDRTNWLVVLSGGIITLFFWLLSLLIVKKINI